MQLLFASQSYMHFVHQLCDLFHFLSFDAATPTARQAGLGLDLRHRAPLRSRAPVQVILGEMRQICAPLRSRRKTLAARCPHASTKTWPNVYCVKLC